jgi:hypothetical protein
VRPDVSEQLDGIRYVLEEVIAPQVSDPYAAGILNGLLGALGSVAAGWVRVPQFLRWDADETAAVLDAARPYLDDVLLSELNDVVDNRSDDGSDVPGLTTHHRRLRGMLERAVPSLLEHAEFRSLLIAHFRSRIERFPLSMVPPTRNTQTGGIGADATR